MFYVICLLISLLIFKLYISIKYPFWNRQPIFHIYNLYYWFYRGVIYKNYPKVDKIYYDMSISHLKYNNLKDNQKENVKKFIQLNWTFEKLNNEPYMDNLDYISLFKDEYIDGLIGGEMLKMDKDNIIYVDYLCVDKNKRNKNMAPKLIYNFFLNNYKDSKIFLFKWENKNMNILPLCVYNVYHYKDIKFSMNRKLSEINIIKINKNQLYLLNENDIKEKFNLSIFQNIDKIHKMIDDNFLTIYAAFKNKKLIGLYFFKCYKNQVYNCYASVNYDTTHLFTEGFHLILETLHTFTLSIDDISNSNVLINSLKMFKPFFVEKHSYYFYNYIKMCESSKDVFILN